MDEPSLSDALEKNVNLRTSGESGPENLTRPCFRPHIFRMAHVTGLDRKSIISICIG
jgi:hypothetical protein